MGANLTSPPGDMASAGRKLIGSERWPCAVSVGAPRPLPTRCARLARRTPSLPSAAAHRDATAAGQAVAMSRQARVVVVLQRADRARRSHRAPARSRRALPYICRGGRPKRSGALAPSRLRVRRRYHAQVSAENGGGPGIRTPKGLAPRRISSPLPCQLRLALRGRNDRYLRYLTKRGRMGIVSMGQMGLTDNYSDVAFSDRGNNARGRKPERHACSSAWRSG